MQSFPGTAFRAIRRFWPRDRKSRRCARAVGGGKQELPAADSERRLARPKEPQQVDLSGEPGRGAEATCTERAGLSDADTQKRKDTTVGKKKDLAQEEAVQSDCGEKEKTPASEAAAEEQEKERSQPSADAAEEKKHQPQPVIACISTSDIPVMLPGGFKKLKYPGIESKELHGTHMPEATYEKKLSQSIVTIAFCPISEEEALPVDPAELIALARPRLNSSQGFIKVQAGETADGFSYVYLLIKDSPPSSWGMQYHLRVNLFSDKSILEVTGRSIEMGFLGYRDDVILQFGKEAGVFQDIGEHPNFFDMDRDPYDPTVKEGYLMHISEEEGLDRLLPANGLSQLREVVMAIVDHKLVKYKEDDPSVPVDEDLSALNDRFPDMQPKERMKKIGEIIRPLFTDACMRTLYTPELDWEKIKAETRAHWKEEHKTGRNSVQDSLSTRNACKIIYYIMAADGKFYAKAKACWEAVGEELDPDFAAEEKKILEESQFALAGLTEPGNYANYLQKTIEEALITPVQPGEKQISTEDLAETLLKISARDEKFGEMGERLLQYVLKKVHLDDAAVQEIKSRLETGKEPAKSESGQEKPE